MKGIAETLARRATAVVWGAVALTAVSILLALGLESSAAPGALADQDSSAAKATDRLHREFGGEPVLVLVRTRSCPGGRNCPLTDLVLTPDIIRLLSFEGCVSGNIPKRAKSPAPVCDRVRESKPFQVVNGPGTFINESARQISSRIREEQRRNAVEVKRATDAAQEIATAKGLSPAQRAAAVEAARKLALRVNASRLSLQYGIDPRTVAIANPSFVHELAFDPSISYDAPKTRFAQYFPSRTSAVVELRPRSGLSESETRAAIDLVREAAASGAFRLENANYVVTGEPVVALGVAEEVSDALIVLLIATLVIVTAAVALVSRFTRLLVPLAPAVATVALTFGLMSLFGTTLTIAAIAILPVLAGIAAALAIHFQRSGRLPLAAVGAAVIGFGALVASPVPMVRTFGAYMALGIVLSLVFVVTLISAFLHGEVRVPSFLRRLGALGSAALSRLQRSLVRPASLTRRPAAWLNAGWGRLIGIATRWPRTVLGIAAVTALLGWALAPQSDAVTGLGRLAPEGVREVKDLDALGRASGMERGVNVIVSADDVTAPGVIPWMVAYQRKVLSRHGYTERRPCPRAELCPAVALTDLFGSARERTRVQTRRLLNDLPRYFTQGVISRDRRTANISFLIRRMPIDRQEDVIADLRRQLDPPAGVRAELAGPTVLAVDAADFGKNGRTLALIALAGVLVMLVAFGFRQVGGIRARMSGAAVSLVPVAIAAGWSALILLAPGVDLNPMSATLGALVVGLGGYGTIVLSSRYREARASGLGAEASVTRAYVAGNVLLASGAVVLAGFATLIVSDIRMLDEFGAIAVIDLAIVLIGAAFVLPAALIWAEKLPADVRAAPKHVRRLGGMVGRVRRSRPLRRRGEA
jgi:predicted RND superfamily exporter protein